MHRTQKTLRNIKFALASQILSLLIKFIYQRVFVLILGAEYLGISGVFSNILSMLSLAEMGIGTAIVYNMYEPLATGNKAKINSLMKLYKTTYNVIGVVVLVLGASLTPFLEYFITDVPDVSDIELIYVLYVINSAASYFFVYKKSILIADQKKYIESVITLLSTIAMYTFQIIVIYITRNYVFCLSVAIVFTIVQNIVYSVVSQRMYPYMNLKTAEPIDKEDLDTIKKNTMALVCHKIGGIVVNGTDNLILAKFVSVVSAGVYSNYLLIKTSLNTFLMLIFNSATASIGNLNATSGKEENYSVFKRIFFAASWLYGFASICLYALYNPFIEIWIGKEYLFSMPIVAVIILNFYITGMRSPILVTREAMGLFWADRYKAIFEALINLVASVILAKKFGIIGIFIGTLISTLTTCFWIDPFVLYRQGLHRKLRSYFVSYAIYTLVTVIIGFITIYLVNMISIDGIFRFVLRLLICGIVPNTLYIIAYHRNPEFEFFFGVMKKFLLRK